MPAPGIPLIRPPKLPDSRNGITTVGGLDATLMAPIEHPGVVEEEIVIDCNDEADEPSAEVEPIKQANNPTQPTMEQLESHRCDHMPYRSWCKQCVMGRGRDSPHSQGQGSQIPIIGIDYFFITVGGVRK